MAGSYILISTTSISLLAILSYAKSPVLAPSTPPPEIWLTIFEETDSFENTLAQTEFRFLSQFDNELISKFNATDYIIQNDIQSALFTCQAKYPVIWSVPHLKQVENQPYSTFETFSSRMSDFYQDQNAVPRNEVFHTFLDLRLFFVENFFSVNFTCGKADDNTVFSSIHLYYIAKDAIEYAGKTIHVYVDPSKDKYTPSTFILPCRPATPNVTIILEKQMDKVKWKRFKYPSKYVNFDPKVGFIMNKNPMGKSSMIFGLYRCTVSMEQGDEILDSARQQQMVYLNVTSSSGQIDIEDVQFQSNLELHGDSMIMYSHKIFAGPTNSEAVNFSLKSYKDTDFLCCSGVHNYVPTIHMESCTSYLECQLLKWAMAEKLQWNVSSVTNYTENSIYVVRECRENGEGSPIPSDCCEIDIWSSTTVFCNGINVDFAEHLVNVFSEYLFPVRNRSQGGKGIYLSTFKPEANSYDSGLSSKIFLTIGHPITSKQLDEDNGEYYDRERGLNFGEIVTFSEADYEEMLPEKLERRREALSKKIAEYPRDHFYVGETLVPICLGWKHFYSDGAYVGVGFKNGTKKIMNLENEPSTTVVYLAGGIYSNNYIDYFQLVHKFGKKIVVHEDMVSVDCWMPEWNTDGWDRMTRNFTVLEGIPPKFERDGEVEESVYFYLGEEGKVLEWRVMGGLPESRIDVTKDGREILKRLKNTSSLDNDSDENKMEYPFETLFNVTLERDNGTEVEFSNYSITVVKIRYAKKITHEMQGTYECTVENVGGKVRRRFRVIVAEKRKILLPILLVTTIVLLLILIGGIGYRHWIKRKPVHRLRRT